MQEDWKALIVKIAQWKQIANENDKLGAFPWHLPRLATGDAAIAEAESIIGVSFPSQYKDFLSTADGWRGFCVSTDLFGTVDFLNGRATRIMRRPDVQEYVSNACLSPQHVLAIGASDVDVDVFLIVSDDSTPRSGEVVWLAGMEIDRYTDFLAFFRAMVGYNERLATQLAGPG